MPTLSMFYGIVIYMFFYDNKKHQLQIHQDDLMTDWQLAVNGQNPLPIKPLE